MKKINGKFVNNEKLIDCIIKIKDDSLSIVYDDILIKISYDDIKKYEYDEQKNILCIVNKSNDSFELIVEKDFTLMNTLSNIKGIQTKKELPKEFNKLNYEVKEDNLNKNTNEREKKKSSKMNVGAILIFIFLIFSATILIQVIFDEDEVTNDTISKEKLYKLDIENYPYLEEDVLSYNHEDTSLLNGVGNKLTVIFQSKNVDSDSECMFYYTEKEEFKLIQVNVKKCQYTIKNDKINMKIDVEKMTINNPNTVIEKTIKEDETLDINGEVLEMGKEIILNVYNRQYKMSNLTYKTVYRTGASMVLFDPKTKEMYDTSGLSIWGHGENSEKTQLDLTKYEIIQDEYPYTSINR